MIDIHSHILPFVDDGSESLENSLSMLGIAREQGVTGIILTPHHRRSYGKDIELVRQEFDKFKQVAKEKAIDVELYLGQEIYLEKDYKAQLQNGMALTLNQTEYVLLEYDFIYESDILNTVFELKKMGYKPIVSHIERYSYVDVEMVEEIRSVGGLIQVNATSIVGKKKGKYFKIVKKLLKNGLVDFVASDVHYNRENLMGKAYAYVDKKFGKQTAEKLFTENALKIIKGQP